jgi:subtilase family serine protease
MRRTFVGAAVVLTSLSLGAASASALPGLGAAARGPVRGQHVLFGCAVRVPARTAGCLGQAIADASRGNVGPQIMSGPTGYGPAQIQKAYGLTGLSSGGKTVAIVDAYSDPNAASDLATFRKTYNLSPCTVASGCLKIENETGATSPLPSADAGWSEEISLDLDAVSSACPDCHILLVEANSANTPDLMTAENTAAASGAVAVSNSYGGSEASTDTTDDSAYRHPGVAITVSSGDSGYGVEWPASSPYVTAVGGTTLSTASNTRGFTETAWSGAGSGCSAYEPKPTWQHDAGCAKRTVADVAADADPNTGLGVYDTYNTCGSSSFCDYLIELGVVQGLDGWAQVGGTSLSSPIISSVYALAGNTASTNGANQPYAATSGLYDVTSGSNGSCSGSYLCTAGTGYDGPTGLGTPDGIGAF